MCLDAQSPSHMTSPILHSDIEEATRWRRDLHQHPELGFKEHRTSNLIAELLSEWGYRVTRGIADTGVVATLGDGSGPSIGLRADIDALPITETSGVEWASKTPGVMHACGHDGHTATLLLAARAIARDPGTYLSSNGSTLHLIFQPAEENDAGAQAMIKDGLFKRFECDAVYAIHNWPTLPQSQVVARDGEMMAAFAVFSITISGRGGHAAMPEQSDGVIAATARITAALQEIPARDLAPLDSGVVSITQVNAGTAWNVCPSQAQLRGTARWYSQAVGNQIELSLNRIVNGIAAAHGCTAEVSYDRRYPATINTPENAILVRNIAKELGLEIPASPPSMASEDFSFMLNEKPGAYIWLGAAKETPTPGLHHPSFDFNDAILPIGARLWVALVERYNKLT